MQYTNSLSTSHLKKDDFSTLILPVRDIGLLVPILLVLMLKTLILLLCRSQADLKQDMIHTQ
ncbi:hypothetical protein [Stenomitos frigidus]|uniref:Uncharacterized protein n=1 Tax=Stenomitos frigidus ULC18 TaxID=2107698 RepID=A0A2T1DT84_9CYAN|nr:hypothetical protein [Stenomitos frigidus]PSB23726.1 hypothetical protein C7B82_29785 [Stenomitos frigidus ULC18]